MSIQSDGVEVEHEPEYNRFVVPNDQLPKGDGILALPESLVRKMCHRMDAKEG